MERDGERKALGASLLLHLILFLTAAAMGLFSVENPTGTGPPIDVVLYDAGSDAGSSAAGDSAPAAAPVATVDDIVVEDKNIVPEAVQEQSQAPQPRRCLPYSSRCPFRQRRSRMDFRFDFHALPLFPSAR